MNITKKRLFKIKKTRNQSKKKKNPKYKKKHRNRKRRSFRKRKKNNIRKKTIKNMKQQKGGAIRKITNEETMKLNDTNRRAGAGVNQIFQYYDKFYLKTAIPQFDREYGSYSTNAAFTQMEYVKNYDMEDKTYTWDIGQKKILLTPVYFGKKSTSSFTEKQINKMPRLWQFLNSLALVIENKSGTKTKNILSQEGLKGLKDDANDISIFLENIINNKDNKDNEEMKKQFNNLTLYGFNNTDCVPIWNKQKNPFKQKNQNRLKVLQEMFKQSENKSDGATTGEKTVGGGSIQFGGGLTKLKKSIEAKKKSKKSEENMLKEKTIPKISDENLPNYIKTLKEKLTKYLDNIKEINKLITSISSSTKGIDDGRENKFQSNIKQKQKLAETERNIKQSLIENSPLTEEQKNTMKKKVNDDYSKAQNKILNQKQKHDFAKANKDMGMGSVIPRSGPVKGQGTFSTDNYFKPSTNKLDPNDSDFMPKPIKTWGIQMDPQKNGLFAHINIRPNHPYQLDKENIVINKFLKHDVPEWLQFVGDSLENRHKVDGFDGTPWHWPHNDEKTEEAGKEGDKGEAGKAGEAGEKASVEGVEQKEGEKTAKPAVTDTAKPAVKTEIPAAEGETAPGPPEGEPTAKPTAKKEAATGPPEGEPAVKPTAVKPTAV
jgi:hypothetical protein